MAYLKLVKKNYCLYWLQCRAVRLKFRNYPFGPRTVSVWGPRPSHSSTVSYKL